MPLPEGFNNQLQDHKKASEEVLAFFNSANAKAAFSELADSKQQFTEEAVLASLEKHGAKPPAGASLKATIRGGPQAGAAQPAFEIPKFCVELCISVGAFKVCGHVGWPEGFGWGGC
jgi:hypothetical protein